ncbi:hypothetical protein BKA70DRAFT_1438095 [Coprinopsis sp. MPI-PUGE-AT-0042]|nr:hypothetical protein BKA70DRAFT_1438095 [Coprinopsis sp. MPI-PUGE-AT-0042]
MPIPESNPDDVWLQDLSDPFNYSRQRIRALIGFELPLEHKPFDQAAADTLERHLLQTCLGNMQLFSLMLRTPFMDDHQTPLQWAIAHLPWGWSPPYPPPPSLPAIYHALLTWSLRGRDERVDIVNLYDDVAQACCRAKANWLFQYFNIRAQATPEHPAFWYTLTQTTEAEFAFGINAFQARMNSVRFVDLRVLLQGKIYSVSIVAAGTGWILTLKVITDAILVHNIIEPYVHYKTLEIIALRPTNPPKEFCFFKLDIEGLNKDSPVRTTSAACLQYSGSSCGTYVQNDGVFKGYLRFRKQSSFF